LGASFTVVVCAASQVSSVQVSSDGGGPWSTSRCTLTMSNPSASACRASATGSAPDEDELEIVIPIPGRALNNEAAVVIWVLPAAARRRR
jgi:hypothetical protein